ncbi:glycerophosphodiester phosphodiesterase [Actinokineospora iranica]|uniref:glycerophosphodiester phosphodiesterase n=1 Tax=Actinokineospora iranica TaxID=1271860 RepID=A0A1G6Q6Y9_9PSEU|nr:glycerophosphoryl diester phosphodiesterase [Actinokineospora iranica]
MPRSAFRTLGVAVSALALLGSATMSAATAAPDQVAAQERHGHAAPLVLGHRGASGYRPEHTLASYELAARMGADYIEPDLVSTKDGVLVARHEPEIGGTTDVAKRPEFAARKATKALDGVSVTGWWTEDFTLAELRTLRAVERIPDVRQENTIHNGRHQVPTFQEVVDLSRRLSRELGREIGVYPETKHPTYFRGLGLELEPKLVEVLERNGMNRPNAKVFVQSFEVSNLKALRKRLRVPLIQLTSASGAPYDFVASGDPRKYADLLTPAGLREIAEYAYGIGPAKDQVIPRDATGGLAAPTALVGDAHAAGLKVHPYTFRAENSFLPPRLRTSTVGSDYGDLFTELSAFWAAGVDGVFTDNPDIAVASRAETFPRR